MKTTNKLHGDFFDPSQEQTVDTYDIKMEQVQRYHYRQFRQPYYYGFLYTMPQHSTVVYKRTKYFADFVAFAGGMLFAISCIASVFLATYAKFQKEMAQVADLYFDSGDLPP